MASTTRPALTPKGDHHAGRKLTTLCAFGLMTNAFRFVPSEAGGSD